MAVLALALRFGSEFRREQAEPAGAVAVEKVAAVVAVDGSVIHGIAHTF